MDPQVSIIMPAYNCGKYIEASLRSVLEQSYPHWELIVVDDGSIDDTCHIVDSFRTLDSRITLIKNGGNSGAARARNAGIENAHGRYIAFLDSDDLWHNQKLQKQIQFMQAQNHVFSYTAYQIMDETGCLLSKVISAPMSVGYKELLKTCSIGCLTVMYDSKSLGKLYMPWLHVHEDYLLWLTILKTGVRAHGMNEVLAYYRRRSGSLSSRLLSTAHDQWRVYRDYEKLSFYDSLINFMSYAYHGVKKRV